MGFLTTLLVGVLVLAVYGLITKRTVRKQVKNDGKLYAFIREVQPDSVTFDECDSQGDSKEVKLTSDDGVSDDIKSGELIY